MPNVTSPLILSACACGNESNRNIFQFEYVICTSVAEKKMVELRPIGTRFEVADIGTKALPEPACVMLRNVLLGLTTFVLHSMRKTGGCENV